MELTDLKDKKLLSGNPNTQINDADIAISMSDSNHLDYDTEGKPKVNLSV